MSIQEMLAKIKPFYNVFLMVVVASIAFALGRLSAIEERREPIKVVDMNAVEADSAISDNSSISLSPEPANSSASGEVIGSKTGKKYYFPWCGGLKRVKADNQVSFASIAAARAAGYSPAGNCKGLQ